MEQEKSKLKRKKRKRRNTESQMWRRLLRKDLALSELNLYHETLHTEMVHQALELEKKRRPGDYIL